MTGPALSLRGVVKTFGDLRAVDGLDLEVRTGTCLGLLGPNGAGKSTTMRMLTAQAIADEGIIKRTYQKTYDAVLAAPVDTAELVTAEALWIAVRAGVYGAVPLGIAMAFGLDPSPGMLLVVPIGVVTGFGWACFGIWMSGVVPSIDAFGYVISAVLTPLFLVAGTFFPIDGLPDWASTLALANPLHHCVELVREAVFGLSLDSLGHLAFLLGFGAAMWLMAVRRLRQRLVS